MSALGRWALPLMALISGLAWLGAARAFSQKNAESAMLLREAHGQLSSALNLERSYFKVNRAYASSAADLGMEQGLKGGLAVSFVATRNKNMPFLLVEAEKGEQRFCVDQSGNLYKSSLAKLPALPEWMPAPEGGSANASE